jgi:CheR methyltransferase, SAM binding domain
MIQVRELLKRALSPGLLLELRNCKHWVLSFGSRRPVASRVFTQIHDENQWGSVATVSGPGSELSETQDVRSFLPQLVRRLRIESMLDAPCGDFSWMQHVDLGSCEYTGAEIVAAIVERNRARYGSATRRFMRADLMTDTLPKVDLIFCRDCLIHLSFKDGLRVIDNFRRSRSTYLLVTNDPSLDGNRPAPTGGARGVNLMLPPFNFPPPIESHRDRYEPKEGETLVDPAKTLALWRLADLTPQR